MLNMKINNMEKTIKDYRVKHAMNDKINKELNERMGTLEITSVMNHDKVTNNGIRLGGLEKEYQWCANKGKVTRKDQTWSGTIVINTTKQDPGGGGGGGDTQPEHLPDNRPSERQKLEKEN